MTTALELRPVANCEVENASIVKIRLADGSWFEVGIRMQRGFGIRHFLFAIQSLISEDRLFAAALYDAGLASRNPDGGHGYVMLCIDRIVVPWTKWSEEDRTHGYSKRRPWDDIIYDLVPDTQQRLRSKVAETADYLALMAKTIRQDLELPGPYRI